MWREVFTVFVPGTPAPQGSKDFRGLRENGSAIIAESHKGVKPWRAAIVTACNGLVSEPLDVPVRVRRLYLFDRPKTVRREFPVGNEGDIDKLDRATFDGLVKAGVLRDDRLVVAGHHEKRYTDPAGEPFQRERGAWLRIEVLP